MRSSLILILTAGLGMGYAAWGQDRKPRIAVGGLVAELRLPPELTQTVKTLFAVR
jgi:hypothetical protein